LENSRDKDKKKKELIFIFKKMDKQRIFSGIQPSGNLHIGNYLGAIKNWAEMYEKYDSVFCVVDMHAITVPQEPEELKKNIIKVAKIYLAAGINPEKAIIFVQSQVPAHCELMWILNTITRMSDLDRMTQFKNKVWGIAEGKRGIKKRENSEGKISKEVISRDALFYIISVL